MRWYTIAEAAPILGVSVDTVRRRVKRGQLESRHVRTQHGPTWEICIRDVLEEPVPVAEGTQGAAYGAEGGSQDRSQAMATWAASLLGPIAAELGEARQSMERQAETIRGQAETIGRQGAELEAERERGKMYHAEAERARDELAAAEAFRRRNSRRLAITIALVAAGVLVLVAVLATIDTLLADDLTFHGPSGSALTKAHFLENLRSGRLAYDSITAEEPLI